MAYTGYSYYRFTENMAGIVRNRMSDLDGMYCREDYEGALNAVKGERIGKSAQLIKPCVKGAASRKKLARYRQRHIKKKISNM